MNLVQIILKLLGSGDMISKIASMLGIGQDQAGKAITAAIPSILASLAGAASKPGGADALAGTLSKQDPGLLDNLGDLLSDGNAASKGSSLLGGLLGNDTLGQLGGVLSRFTGVGQEGMGKLLGLLGPIVMGVIGKSSQGLDASGIAKMLAGQKDHIAAALPAGLGGMLGSAFPALGNMLGDAAGAAGSAAKSTVHAAHGAAREAERAGSSMMRWLVPVILLALAFLFLPKMCRKATDAGVAVKDKAADTMAAAADGTKLVGEATDVLKSATESLGSITDEASATTALPKLRDLSTRIGGFDAALANLPPSVQTTVRDALRPLIAKLREVSRSVLALPLVGGQVKPVLDQMFGHLDRLVPPQ